VLFYNTTVEEQLYDLEWTFGVDANTITSNEIDYGLTFVTVDDNSILPLPVALTVIDTNGCQGVIEENITIPNSPNLCDSIDFTLDVMGTDSCDITVGINPIEFQYDTAAYDLTINYSWLASDPAFLQIVGDNNATINNSYALTQENLTLTIEIILESIVDPAQSITCVCSEEYSLTDIVDEYEYFSCDCQPGGPPIADFNVFNEGECGNQGIAFENNSTGGLGSNYEWSFGNNGEYGQSFESSPTVDIIVDGGMSSEVPVNLTITDANGCESSVTQNVAVLQTPNPGTDLEILPICTSLSDDESETVILTFTPEPFFQFGIDQISIDWGLGETLFYTAPPFQPTFEIESPGYDTIGVYYINLELLGLNGCITTINEELFVGNNPQIGSANPGNTDGLCSPVELTFPITNFIQNEISTVYEVYWGDGSLETTYTHQELLDLMDPTTEEVEVSHEYSISSCGYTTPNESPNSFYFIIRASNGCGESITSVDPVRIHLEPAPNITGDTIACVNELVSFSSPSTGTWVDSDSNDECEDGAPNWYVIPMQGQIPPDPSSLPNASNPDTSSVFETTFLEPGLYQINVLEQ
jgi:hypothetical protein